jgi:3-oxoacyl-[acyl-carrier protein] reductase
MAAQFDLRGKVALVTGASSGIGRATALALARNGAAVVLSYLSNDRGITEAVAEIQAMRRNANAVRADVTRTADVARLVEETMQNFGRIDILVNNAGSVVKLTSIEECSAELWDTVIAINLKSVFLCSQAVIPQMKQQQSGRIINLSSLSAMSGGRGAVLPYAAAKGAVNTFTKGLASERLQEIIASTPLRRAGTPEEVAELIAYLSSDEAGFITGEIFSIDGGR